MTAMEKNTVASPQIIKALTDLHARSDKVLKETQPLAEMRAQLEANTARQQLDPAVRLETVDAGGVEAVWVTPPNLTTDSIYLFFHGGAYVKACVAASHVALVGLCKALGGRALSVDYRVAPEHPYPAGLRDAEAAYRHLLAAGHKPQNIALAGSSAGGGLALALLLACRDSGLPQPGAVVAIAPWADLTQSGESMLTRADRDPVLTKPYLDRFARDYAGDADPKTPTISPVFADYSGLETAILVQVGSEEVLYDDAVRVVDKAKAAGLTAELEVYDKGYHGWQNLGETVPESAAAATNAAAFLRRNLQG
jgi:acetyl esterase/lipase